MKKQAQSYITFTRKEHIGIVVLCLLVVLLITIRATMNLWVHPAIDKEKEKQLVSTWETFKRAHTVVRQPIGDSKDYQDAFDDTEAPLPDIINLNKADSATLVRLKGIGPVTAARIVAWRKNNGPFTTVHQLLQIHSISTNTFNSLKKHLTVDTVSRR
jgi:competence ComEA-like helix-hairpin-helix protein